jgi:hypothetical protein
VSFLDRRLRFTDKGSRGGDRRATMKIKIRSGIKAGALLSNHNQRKLKIRSGIKAGAVTTNHNQKLR